MFEPKSGCSKTHDYVLPYHISPPPKIKQSSWSRGRKSGSAAVITDSPYKAGLEEAISKQSIKSLHKKPVKWVKGIKNSSVIKRKFKKNLFKPRGNSSSNTSDNKSFRSDLQLEQLDDMTADDVDAECLFCEGEFLDDVEANYGFSVLFAFFGLIVIVREQKW